MKKINFLIISCFICSIIPVSTFYSTNSILRLLTVIFNLISVVLVLIIVNSIRKREKYVVENKTIQYLIAKKEKNKTLSKIHVSIILEIYIVVFGIANTVMDLYFYFKRLK